MRTVVIVLFALVTATPVHASKSCMTMAEARQKFSTSHLYWHGAGHCWDATPPNHRLAGARLGEDQPARRDNREASGQEPKWRNAMSEMLPGDAPIEPSPMVSMLAISEPVSIDWLERWVDVVQVASPALVFPKSELASASSAPSHGLDPTITPLTLILMLTGLVVTLALVELLFRNFILDWRR